MFSPTVTESRGCGPCPRWNTTDEAAKLRRAFQQKSCLFACSFCNMDTYHPYGHTPHVCISTTPPHRRSYAALWLSLYALWRRGFYPPVSSSLTAVMHVRNNWNDEFVMAWERLVTHAYGQRCSATGARIPSLIGGTIDTPPSPGIT